MTATTFPGSDLLEEVDLEKSVPCEDKVPPDQCPNEASWHESHSATCGSNICTPCKNTLNGMIVLASLIGGTFECIRCGSEVQPDDIRFRPL